MRYCDLHMHSTASDGTDPPEALADLARDAGLAAIALTDHDTTAGIATCRAACQAAGIGFVPGIEISVDPGPTTDGGESRRRGTLHILGYFVDPDSDPMREVHQRGVEARAGRNQQLVQNLNRLGVNLTYQDVQNVAAEQNADTIGRPHVAEAMRRAGYVESIADAFDRYIGQGKPAYTRADRIGPAEAIGYIHRAGGLAVLAHPPQLSLRNLDVLQDFLTRLKAHGLDGIETRHSDHRPDDVDLYHRLADEHDLLITGGSDYHGSRKRTRMGSQDVPISVYENLLNAWHGLKRRPIRSR